MWFIMPQTISVHRARKLLGPHSKALSDDQIEELVLVLELLADEFISQEGSKKDDAQ